MRRLGLLVLALTAISFSTAVAAKLEVRADNLASSRTTVSMATSSTTTSTSTSTTTSTTTTTTTTQTLYVRGDSSPGSLSTDSTAGGSTESETFAVSQGSGGVRAVTAVPAKKNDPVYFFVWRTDPLAAPLRLAGSVELYVFQNAVGGGGTGAVSVALLDCPQGAIGNSSTCDPIGPEVTATPAADGRISLGTRNHTINASTSAKRELRMKVANFSNTTWKLQWGFKQNRDSRLVLTVAA